MTDNTREQREIIMHTIGVTGGIGAGKSEVLNYLQDTWGAAIVKLDDVSRSFLDRDGRCYDEALRLFGPEIRREDGTLNRAGIAAIIFENESMREALNDLIHPAVRDEVMRIVREEREAGTEFLFIEAALLIEAHYDAIFDEMWYIYADATTRCSRLAKSRGYDRQRIERTMASQLSDAEFRAHADFVVDNSGEFSLTCQEIDNRMLYLREHTDVKRS